MLSILFGDGNFILMDDDREIIRSKNPNRITRELRMLMLGWEMGLKKRKLI